EGILPPGRSPRSRGTHVRTALLEARRWTSEVEDLRAGGDRIRCGGPRSRRGVQGLRRARQVRGPLAPGGTQGEEAQRGPEERGRSAGADRSRGEAGCGPE